MGRKHFVPAGDVIKDNTATCVGTNCPIAPNCALALETIGATGFGHWSPVCLSLFFSENDAGSRAEACFFKGPLDAQQSSRVPPPCREARKAMGARKRRRGGRYVAAAVHAPLPLRHGFSRTASASVSFRCARSQEVPVFFHTGHFVAPRTCVCFRRRPTWCTHQVRL